MGSPCIAKGTPTHILKAQHKTQCLAHTWNSKNCLNGNYGSQHSWGYKECAGAINNRCQSVEVIQKSRTAPSPLLGICFLIPTPLQTHSSESPTPSVCQASWPLVSHSLFLYFYIPTTDFWGLITRHLTNGPSVLPITQKKVSPSLTLTRCTTHRDETLKPTPPAAYPLRVTMTTTKEKGGTLEVMEMCANRRVWMVCLHPQTLQLTATTCQQFSECQFFTKNLLKRKAARHNDTGL